MLYIVLYSTLFYTKVSNRSQIVIPIASSCLNIGVSDKLLVTSRNPVVLINFTFIVLVQPTLGSNSLFTANPDISCINEPLFPWLQKYICLREEGNGSDKKM